MKKASKLISMLLSAAMVCTLLAGCGNSGGSAQVSDELSCTYEIYARSGAHCAPLMHEALGTREQGGVRQNVLAFIKFR